MDSFAATLRRTLAAGVRGVFVATREEGRALEFVEDAASSIGWPVHTWSAASGVDNGGRRVPLAELLTELLASAEEHVWVLLDPTASLSDPATLRAFREVAQRSRGPSVVAIDPRDIVLDVPITTRIPEVVSLPLPPPDLAELEATVRWAGEALAAGDFPDAATVLDEAAASIARAALGVPRAGLERILAEGVLEVGVDPEALARFVRAQKPKLVDTAGWLEPIAAVPANELAGLDAYKDWLRQRTHALDPRAAASGIRAPRGALLCGVQGCGKSLAARATADILGVELFRLEPGRIFGGVVGLSEANLREILQTADAMAPIVLWLDEIDKGLAGLEGTRSDGGTAARVVGGLLTWLQERTRAVFVVATANRVDRLPPELLRRGRLDEVFFVDLPGPQARAQILDVHLQQVPARQLGQIPKLAEPAERFAAVARSADGFSGAELEAALVEARLEAFAAGRALAPADLERALAATVPLSVTRSESIDALRSWASHRARSAARET